MRASNRLYNYSLFLVILSLSACGGSSKQNKTKGEDVGERGNSSSDEGDRQNDVVQGDGDGDGDQSACESLACSGNFDCAASAEFCACEDGFQDEDANGSCLADCSEVNCDDASVCSIENGVAACRVDDNLSMGGAPASFCSSVTCAENASCDEVAEACLCNEGFQDEDSNGSCLADCSGLSCGSGVCTVISGAAGCDCDAGFAGESCDECAPGFSGAACGSCAPGFIGAACEACDTGLYGASCSACPTCENGGSCNEGLAGSGLCDCATGFSGALCGECAIGYVDDADSCDSCAPGFADIGGSGGALCESCQTDFFGPTCSACPTCENGGSCNEGLVGDGACSCVGNFAGALCAECALGYQGVACDACAPGFQDYDLNGSCEVECAGQTCDGLQVARGLATGVHSVILESGFTDVYIDGEFDAGAWILVGRGREGWTWAEAGDATLDWNAVKDNLGVKEGFVPRFLASGLLNGLIENSLGIPELSDIQFRLKRAAEPFGTQYQNVVFSFTTRSEFSWALNVNNDTNRVAGVFLDSVQGVPGGSTSFNGRLRDVRVANDDRRIFTFNWSSHNNQAGFSYGSSVRGVTNDNPNTFVWEYTDERHAIPYTEVYVRLPGCGDQDLYCGSNALSCDDSAGIPQCSCGIGYEGERCRTCASGFQDNDGNGVCSPVCAADSCPISGEACDDSSGAVSCAAFSGVSGVDCTSILAADSAAVSGTYRITPQTTFTSSIVYCDMTTDGGGYSFFKVDADSVASLESSVKAPDAEAYCEQRGMQLFIPRTEAHLAAAHDIALDVSLGPSATTNYLYIMGIYPNQARATCRNLPLQSGVAGCDWRAGDDGPFWVSDRTNIGEPNGDNAIDQSMSYTFNTSSAAVVNYNDITSGYSARYFMCDTGVKQ